MPQGKVSPEASVRDSRGLASAGAGSDAAATEAAGTTSPALSRVRRSIGTSGWVRILHSYTATGVSKRSGPIFTGCARAAACLDGVASPSA